MKSNENTNSCCGGKRAKISNVHREKAKEPIKNRDLHHQPVAFKYTGQKSLRVRGLVSGRYYYFGKPGTVLEIDPIDLGGFHGIPNLDQYQ